MLNFIFSYGSLKHLVPLMWSYVTHILTVNTQHAIGTQRVLNSALLSIFPCVSLMNCAYACSLSLSCYWRRLVVNVFCSYCLFSPVTRCHSHLISVLAYMYLVFCTIRTKSGENSFLILPVPKGVVEAFSSLKACSITKVLELWHFCFALAWRNVYFHFLGSNCFNFVIILDFFILF